MKKYFFIFVFLCLTTHAEIKHPLTQEAGTSNINYEIKDYLVLSGFSKHTDPAPAIMGKWNESNYGLGWQRSFKPDNEDYRYAVEGGFFKESFGKESAYFAGSWLHDFTQSPRLSIGAMAGVSYRVTKVRDSYYSRPRTSTHTARYGDRHIIGMAGFLAQLEIPHTPAVIQATYIPKVGNMISGVIFTQLLFNF